MLDKSTGLSVGACVRWNDVDNLPNHTIVPIWTAPSRPPPLPLLNASRTMASDQGLSNPPTDVQVSKKGSTIETSSGTLHVQPVCPAFELLKPSTTTDANILVYRSTVLHADPNNSSRSSPSCRGRRTSSPMGRMPSGASTSSSGSPSACSCCGLTSPASTRRAPRYHFPLLLCSPRTHWHSR